MISWQAVVRLIKHFVENSAIQVFLEVCFLLHYIGGKPELTFLVDYCPLIHFLCVNLPGWVGVFQENRVFGRGVIAKCGFRRAGYSRMGD